MEQKTEASQAVEERQLLDDDGENRAVRTFLMQYGVPSLTVGAMCQHMERSGWGHEYWPPFAKRHPAPRAEHLTKAGAQIWIRYLMSLERAALKAQPAPTEVAQGANKQLFENIEQLAQGEDSARLDAARYRWLRNPKRSHSSVGRIIDNTGKATHISEYALDRAIDESRARASAETGGVKP